MAVDSIYGIPANALLLTEKRAEVLASNLVNNSTPNYKARDIDFSGLLKQEQNQLMKLATTRNRHISNYHGDGSAPLELRYRIPLQPSTDGNTVENDIEIVKFMENAIRYQANITFVKGTQRHLLKAIRGE